MSTRRLGALLIVSFFLLIASPLQAFAQEAVNLLQAADFEDSFPREEGDPLRVGEGWEAWYLEGPDGCHDQPPTFEPSKDVAERNHAGRKSTQIGLRDATYTAGIYQVVDGVEPGQNYEFSAWGHVLYATTPTAQVSDGPDPRMKVGIDPTGGVNPFAETVRWSPVTWEFDTYYQFSVVAIAENSTLTVFTFSTQEECLASNFTFWDDASLVATDDPETPAEIPDNPNDIFRDISPDAIVKTGVDEFPVGAAVTGTTGGTEADTTEDEPDATGGAATSGTGSICLLMFQDENTNGAREVQEIKLEGGTFTLTDGSQVIGTYTTDGLSEPYCFSALAPGNYMLTWQSEGFEATNAQGWAVSLTEGETLSREFGAAEATGETQREGGGIGRLLRALAIAGGVVLFLLILGGAGYFVLSRRDSGSDDEPPPPDPFGDLDDDDTLMHGGPGDMGDTRAHRRPSDL